MILFISILCCLSLVCLNGAQQNGQYSEALWELLIKEKSAGRVIGSVADLFPTSAEFYNGNLDIKVDKYLLNDNDSDIIKDSAIIGGKGVQIKPTKYPISIDITSPNANENVCGLIIGNAYLTNPIKKVQILWKPKPHLPWDLLSVPSTGEYLFEFDSASETGTNALLFDPVPIANIRLLVYAKDGERLNLTLAMMYGCQFPGTIEVACNELFEQNPRFSEMKEGIPKGISCPSVCPKTKQCIGYKVYSTISPICSVAQQALLISNSGQFFLYKIPQVAFFRDQANPFLNNGIYCKRSTIVHSGMTFNRVYYDFAVKEYQSKKSQEGT